MSTLAQTYVVLTCHARTQWRRYTRARQVKCPAWMIRRPGTALPITLLQ